MLSVFGYRISKLSQPPVGENAFAAMKRLVSDVDELIIFDVGAHHGHTSISFKNHFPTSIIYSFEPFDESFSRLKLNTQHDSGIKVFNFGLSDQQGIQSFNSNPSSETNSLLSTDEHGSKTWGKGLLETRKIVKAQFKTIDQVMNEMDIPKIDILKLDVQGAEHLVINGAFDACANGAISVIYSEIITQPTYINQKTFHDSLALFHDNGFDLYNTYNANLTDEGRLRQLDVIFTKKT